MSLQPLLFWAKRVAVNWPAFVITGVTSRIPVEVSLLFNTHFQRMAAVSAFNKFPLKVLVIGTQPSGVWVMEISGVFTTRNGTVSVAKSIQPDCEVAVSVGMKFPKVA